jgi:hypothetical protein
MPLAASQRLLRELAEWRPPEGVLSVCLDVDPADRGEGWRIALRERLGEAVSAGDGARAARERAAERVLERFPANAPHGEGRTQLGFVEVGGDGRELWHGIQLRLLDGAEVSVGPRPRLVPLARVLEAGAPTGAAVVSSERVRVLEWTLGRTEELDDLELEIYSLDWRERKSPQRSPGPGTGTGTSAAGRDQYGQRLDHNRERFLHQAGELIASRHGDREWRHLVVFGNSGGMGALRAGLGPRAELAEEVHADLIGASVGKIGERLSAEVEHLTQSRAEALIARIENAVGAEPAAALGPDEVLQALEQGRARHVVFDERRGLGEREGIPVGELIVAGAAMTDAEVTPVSGLAAEALAKREGAAALLRY